ncbi:MAG: AAA family ATPase [Cyanobacteria bacterium SBLK]|nr:AAA family ATPase [Cyanobacteria bacterium SBLK]
MIDLRGFYRVTNPSQTLEIAKPEDRKYYINFSSVRGVDLIKRLTKRISFLSPDDPTCTLFTGHIGCGKSTELKHLKLELEKKDFHVVYFESSEDLEMTDVDISDVLLAIARRLSQSLEGISIGRPQTLMELLREAGKILFSEVEIFQFESGLPAIAGLPEVKFSTRKAGEFSLELGIGKITGRAKSDPRLREQLNQYLGPRKIQLLEAINQELIEPAIAKLKQQNKAGLVVIADNLDRLDPRQKPWKRGQHEYLFVDQGEYLTRLACHMIYTMPLALKFSNDYGMLTQRFDDPQVLPMVPVKHRGDREDEEGIKLLRQMVLVRAFPDLSPEERLQKIDTIFESPESLDRLCRASGGHVRDLLRLLNRWIEESGEFPLTGKALTDVIRERQNIVKQAVSDEEWDLLRRVQRTKKVSDTTGYQALIRSRFVFEYCDSEGLSWFDVNPLLADAEELRIKN